MIGRLSGTLIVKQPPLLLLEVGGVGYEVEAPMSTFYTLPALNDRVVLHIHTVVREDAHLLYGFAHTAEKALFRELIKISGVGPKLALALLSGLSVEDFWEAVRNGEASRLVKVPGVGKKTAERLTIELRDKAGASGSAGDVPATLVAGATMTPEAEARHALSALGYKPVEIDRLLKKIPLAGKNTEQIIQEALRHAVT